MSHKGFDGRRSRTSDRFAKAREIVFVTKGQTFSLCDADCFAIVDENPSFISSIFKIFLRECHLGDGEKLQMRYSPFGLQYKFIASQTQKRGSHAVIAPMLTTRGSGRGSLDRRYAP